MPKLQIQDVEFSGIQEEFVGFSTRAVLEAGVEWSLGPKSSMATAEQKALDPRSSGQKAG
jgi:hypothetical protein